IMTDLGATAPLNGFMTIFGQFFDHGLTSIEKGGSGTVFIPLKEEDPLYVPGSPTNFMVLTRATNQPGPDGVVGTADDFREAANYTTPWIDLNQNYASHASHQVFLREYKLVDGKPVATGWLLAGSEGGPPTWADIKTQAREMLGIELSDMDVHRIPLLATDLYGNFIPGANGFAQLVTAPNTMVEGNPAAPVAASTAMATEHAFLADISHNANPKAGQTADADTETGNAIPLDNRGNAATYDNELLDRHFIAGDGRANENVALTAIHHVFHSEHNGRVDQIKKELIANGDIALLNEWLAVPIETM
ncbi:MAG: peroxidase family protein, partial [Sphingorhabdus sp.]